jgi:outer membrane protein assembly factor BamB
MAISAPKTRWSATLALLHPAWWAFLFLLLLNDHLLKGSGLLGSALTGKISDFAGMLVAPALVGVLLGARSGTVFIAVHIVVGVGFAALKLSAPCAAAWCALGAALGCTWKVVCDASDLAALPMLAVSLWLFGSRLEGRGSLRGAWRRTVTRAAQATGLLAVMATSRPPPRSPVLTPSSVYVGEGGRLKELDRATGALRRVVDPDLDWHGQPMIVGDFLYHVSSFRTVRAYELSTSRARWERKVGTSTQIVHVDEKRLLAQSEDVIVALDAKTGTLLWQVSSPGSRAAALEDRVALSGWEKTLSFYSLTDGRPLASAGLPGARLAVLDKALYALDAGRVLELDSAGATLRRSDLLLSEPSWAWNHFPARALLVSTPSPEASGLFDGDLVAVDPVDLHLLWRLPRGLVAGSTSQIVLTECFREPGLLVARDAASGGALWSVPWGYWDSSLGADDSLVVSYVIGGEVTARDPANGSVRWSVKVGD